MWTCVTLREGLAAAASHCVQGLDDSSHGRRRKAAQRARAWRRSPAAACMTLGRAERVPFWLCVIEAEGG